MDNFNNGMNQGTNGYNQNVPNGYNQNMNSGYNQNMQNGYNMGYNQNMQGMNNMPPNMSGGYYGSNDPKANTVHIPSLIQWIVYLINIVFGGILSLVCVMNEMGIDDAGERLMFILLFTLIAHFAFICMEWLIFVVIGIFQIMDIVNKRKRKLLMFSFVVNVLHFVVLILFILGSIIGVVTAAI